MGYRRGLEPEQPRPAAGETQVAAARQRVGPAVGRAVASLHGVDGQGVGRLLGADAHPAGQGAQIVANRQIEPQLGDARRERVQRSEAKALVGHGHLLGRDEGAATLAWGASGCQREDKGLLTSQP